MPEMRQLHESDFTEEALKANEKVVVLFESPWCQGCHAVEGMIREMPDGEAQGCLWGKVDVSTEPAIAQRFGVLSLPTLLLIQSGEVAERITGGKVSKERLLSCIKG